MWLVYVITVFFSWIIFEDGKVCLNPMAWKHCVQFRAAHWYIAETPLLISWNAPSEIRTAKIAPFTAFQQGCASPPKNVYNNKETISSYVLWRKKILSSFTSVGNPGFCSLDAPTLLPLVQMSFNALKLPADLGSLNANSTKFSYSAQKINLLSHLSSNSTSGIH